MSGTLHPADHIKEYLEVCNWKPIDLARASGISRGRLSEILAKKRNITPSIALKLEKALGLKAHIWLSIQVNWDLYVERKRNERSTHEERKK